MWDSRCLVGGKRQNGGISGTIQAMNRTLLLLALLCLLAVSCGTGTPAPVTEALASPTVPASATPSVTETPPAPTLTPTAALIAGLLTAEVNVRSGPGTMYESLGLLGSGEAVQVNLQSDDGQWYRILYPAAPDGYGWVSARYVTLAEPTSFFATVPNQQIPRGAIYGRVLQRLNVRAGPGTTFETLGVLEADAIVLLKGRNTSASWFQIEYPLGTQGRGWVTAQYIQTDKAGQLPVLDEYGTPVSTGTPGPVSLPVTPTPTVGLAAADGDSAAAPAVSVIFSPGGTRRFTYSSQVSAPDGDAEDWVEFAPFASLPGTNARLRLGLECLGNGTLSIELWSGGAPLEGWGTLVCGSRDQVLAVPAGVPYQFRLAVAPGETLRLVHYFLSVENLP